MGENRKYKAQNNCQTGYVMYLKTDFVDIAAKNIFSAWSCYDYPFNVMLKMLSVS